MASGFQFSEQASAKQLMDVIDQASFALDDVLLFLDTHPCDTQAMAYFNQMTEAYENARKAYEAQFGPLTASASRGSAYWSWVEDPWPWEGGNV